MLGLSQKGGWGVPPHIRNPYHLQCMKTGPGGGGSPLSFARADRPEPTHLKTFLNALCWILFLFLSIFIILSFQQVFLFFLKLQNAISPQEQFSKLSVGYYFKSL